MKQLTSYSRWSQLLLSVVIIAATSPSSDHPTSLPTSAPTGAFLAEKSALEALYHSTRGTEWFTKTHWMDATKHVSEWYGVTGGGASSDGTPGTVTNVVLRQNNLAHTLPSELGYLSNVANLAMNANFLTSSIPSEFARLTKMENFYLYDNSLTSSIPSELARLSNVQSFNLYNNSLTSSIPSELALLSTNLLTLHLSTNNLTASLPSELGRLTNVAKLFLQSNHFKASIPTEVGHLQNLGLFDASNNSLSAVIPSEIGSIGSTLNTLILSDNKLQSTFPSSVCNLINLQVVSLSSNRLRGKLPICPHGFPRLQMFDAASNSFEGHLPSVKRWPAIRYLLLHENGFQGSLRELEFNRSRHAGDDDDDDYYDDGGGFHDDQQFDDTHDHHKVDYGSSLVTLTLHDNSLTGPIPPDLAFPRSLKTLTFANNKLSGRLPRELLEQQRSSTGNENGSAMTIYATNNRLSCDLPKWNFTTTQQSLVLIGNRFSSRLPSWVQPIEVKATFLSTVVSVTSRSVLDIRLPPWLTLLIQGCVVALISVPSLVWYSRSITATSRTAIVMAGDDEKERFSSVSRALLSCSHGVATLGAFGLTFLVLFGLGGNFYECGDGFMKYTTAAYVSDAPALEWLLACGAIVWTAALSFVLRRFFSLLPEQRQRQQRHLTPETDATRTAIIVAENGSAEEGTNTIIRCILVALCFTGWFLTLVVVGGAPTVLYVATYSLPDQNVLVGLKGWKINALGSALSLYLSLVSGGLIPLVTKPTVRAMLAIRAPGSSEAKHCEWESVLGIIARTLVVVVLPVISVLLLDNSCFSKWTQLWKMCDHHHHNYFKKTESLEYFVYYAGTVIDPDPVFAPIELSVLNNHAICNTPYQEGKCARGVLEILYPLFTSKLIYAILFAALKPLMASRRKAASPVTIASSGVANPDPEPDPMQALIWYETAFMFGCLSPLMIVLVAVQLYADAITFEWKLRRAPSATMPSWWGAKPLPILRRVLKVHLVLVVFLQSTMVVFFFVDTRLHGWQVVTAVVPLLFVAEVAHSYEKRWHSKRSWEAKSSPSLGGGDSSSQVQAQAAGELEGPVGPPVGDVLVVPGVGNGNGKGATQSPMHSSGWGADYLEPLLDEDLSSGV